MKTKVVNIIIIAITFASTLVAMVFLPDIVPVHFDIAGAVDRWGSKYELLILPATLLLLWIFGDKSVGFFTKQTAKSEDDKLASDAKSNERVMNVTFSATFIIMAVANLGVIYMTFANLESYSLPEIDIIKIVVMLMGLMMVVLGNFMPKTRANGLLGLRCGWSMYNDTTWRKSNLFAGITSVISGLLIIVFGIIFGGIVAAIIMLGITIISSTVMLVYSYLVYKEEKSNESIS